jgi:P27 family predicted phage terminase small subunit
MLRSGVPRPPRHLRAASRRWWSEIAGVYVLEAHQIEILTAAAGCLDRMAEARALIQKDGIVIQGLHSKIAHPAVAIERDARIGFARLVRELGLAEDADESRPPYVPNRYAS